MPAYSYSALDQNGLKKKGVLSAQSEREARRFVKELNLTPIAVQETKGSLSKISKVKNKDIVIMTRQLATLLEANTPNFIPFLYVLENSIVAPTSPARYSPKEIFASKNINENISKLNGSFQENLLVKNVINFITKDKKRSICTPFS